MSSARRTIIRTTPRARAPTRQVSKAQTSGVSGESTSSPTSTSDAPSCAQLPPQLRPQIATQSPASSDARPQPRDIIYNMFLARLNEAARACDYAVSPTAQPSASSVQPSASSGALSATQPSASFGALSATQPSASSVQQKLMTIARNLELGCCIVANRESKKLGTRGVVTPGSNDPCTIAYETAASRIADLLRDPARELFITLMHDDTSNASSIARNVARTDTSQLCPTILREEREIVKLRLGQRIEVHESHLYECHKCHKKRTTYDEYQMRSSDEAPTLAIRCLECGNQWTQHG